MKKILLIFGTRPEAIKMAPLVKAFKKESNVEVKICVTAQHRQMLDQVLEIFDIKPDYDLNLMKKEQDLYDLTAKMLLDLKEVLNSFQPDIVFVHGDTTTAMTASLAAFYSKIKIAHVEAGLRTGNIYSPYPEEVNRNLISILANYHFAPTMAAKENLLKENKSENTIIVTGNTVIDSLFIILNKIKNSVELKNKVLEKIYSQYSWKENKRIILITVHRRESFGEKLKNICLAFKILAENNPEIDFVFPVHLNPNVQQPVKEILSNIANIYLIKPLEYVEFVYMMSKAYFIITDSGGIQEEAPSLSKPVLVLRDTTERPEAVKFGTVKIVGTDKKIIIKTAQELLDNEYEYNKMINVDNPYGDGFAAQRIIDFINTLK